MRTRDRYYLSLNYIIIKRSEPRSETVISNVFKFPNTLVADPGVGVVMITVAARPAQSLYFSVQYNFVL